MSESSTVRTDANAGNHEQCFHTVSLSSRDHKGVKGPGAAYGPSTWEKIDSFTKTLSRHGVSPIVAWGDFAMKYYGVPTGISLVHVLVDDSQLATAFNTLLNANHADVSHDVRTNWDELGARFFQFLVKHPQTGHAFTVLIQGFSVCKPYMTIARARTFPLVHGLSMPPLQNLAESFVVTTFNLPDTKTLTCHLLRVWRSYLMNYGYNPLSEDALQPSELIDERMVSYWRTGDLVK